MWHFWSCMRRFFATHSSNRLRWTGTEVKDAWTDCYRSLAIQFGSVESPTKLAVMDTGGGELLLQVTCRWQKRDRIPEITAGFQWVVVGPLRAHRNPLSASLWTMPAGKDFAHMLYRCWQRVERSLWTLTHQQLSSNNICFHQIIPEMHLLCILVVFHHLTLWGMMISLNCRHLAEGFMMPSAGVWWWQNIIWQFCPIYKTNRGKC